MRKICALFGLLFALASTFTPAYAAPGAAGVHTYVATAAVAVAAPRPNTTETIRARLTDGSRPVAGALMTATWYYKTTVSTCSGVSLASGWASCSRRISRATPGYAVRVAITFTKAGARLATAATGFTPR